ncbi:MAG TPA: NACHT domain-containing protein [Ktedonobacteraceae bacterium]
MTEPVTLIALSALIVKSAPAWLASLGGVILDKSQDAAFDKGKEVALAYGERFRRRIFHLSKKEQLRHLEQALKNATERGLVSYHTLQERDLYRSIIYTLSEPGPLGETLRREIMQLFTLSEEPDLAALTDIYNRHQRFFNPVHQDIDAAPCLIRFFSALIGELYADPYFRPQLSDALQLRAAKSMQLSLLEIVSVLQKIGATLEENYSADDFARDISTYIDHMERTLHQLKIVGVVPKDQGVDPELSGIFVPLRVALRGSSAPELFELSPDLQSKTVNVPSEQTAGVSVSQDSLIGVLEQAHFLVLLGGPGSGKSTATKHLAWSHVAASQSSPLASPPVPRLAGNPLPLRIELRLFNEERKRANHGFLSFATEVLLKREGVEINPQMFKELLMRRDMILIFDGLDEVGTLEERLALVNEIEHFALHYPGNRVLVTSRPVGYDLARFSHPLFFHAEVQAFNDEQIQQFLTNWYTSVLRLSPIPHQDQEEMDLLLATLKENSRLHRLAENPLLLTVITALHRYERLPDRRVQVYDRCADLLLETWAKLKGTHKRWQNMKMIKDEQYACVAYLGFILHERLQEETGEKEDQTVDVTARFLRKKVEDFLRQRGLIAEVAEQQAEARRFIELVQEEAGLIVERGTDESGEALYSFVHRTFQEYFAAADIYERYQQEEDPEIISEFLREHLHDPHWQEVIMLLLGKLKPTPVTKQLRQILQGKIKSRRSCYTEIVQQDLFFVCGCLAEEIKVENPLVEMVISDLKKAAQSSWSPAQRKEAIGFLGRLIQTRHYGEQAKKELMFFATMEGMLDEAGRLEAIQVLYLHSSVHSEERLLASQILADLVKRPDLSVEQIRQTAESLYYRSPQGSEAEQWATAWLRDLVKRSDLSVEQIWQTAASLYNRSPQGSEAEQWATAWLRDLVKRPDLSVEQIWQTAASLYDCSPEGSEAQQWVTTLWLVQLSHSSQMNNYGDVYPGLRRMVPQFHKL